MNGLLSARSFRSAFRAFRHPVEPEARRTILEAWERLDPSLRVNRQTIGRQEEGCGATIGVMPRCDFGCSGCYLGADANAAEPVSMEAIKAQLRDLRGRLGPGGNLQLTDGEVLLRPEAEIVELLRYSKRVGLVPMVMTHGDHFRRQPGLLERLMVDGGLVELSIHIDVTQRGRWGAAYASARRETELMPLREEFAAIIRRARRRTGRPLRVASTLTAVSDNILDIPEVVRWFVRNADAFRILSVQPAAEVGRTRAGVGGAVPVQSVWDQIARGLHGDDATADDVSADHWWFGHPDCSRLVTGLVVAQPGQSPRFARVSMGRPLDRRFLDGFFERNGGICFRFDRLPQIAGRLAGLVMRQPVFMLRAFAPFALGLIPRLDPDRPGRLLGRLLRGVARVHPFSVGSHHFMSEAELESPEGQEREASCIFTVPIDGELVSMCRVNATDVRKRFYAGESMEDVPLTVSAVSAAVRARAS